MRGCYEKALTAPLLTCHAKISGGSPWSLALNLVISQCLSVVLCSHIRQAACEILGCWETNIKFAERPLTLVDDAQDLRFSCRKMLACQDAAVKSRIVTGPYECAQGYECRSNLWWSADQPRAEEATTACFYSISSTQKGLAGIDLGNFLIKQVANRLLVCSIGNCHCYS